MMTASVSTPISPMIHHSPQNSQQLSIPKETLKPLHPINYDISEWLNQSKLNHYESTFKQHCVTIDQLLNLNDQQLLDFAKDTLRIKQLLHRKRLQNAVQKLRHFRTRPHSTTDHVIRFNFDCDPEIRSCSNGSISVSSTNDEVVSKHSSYSNDDRDHKLKGPSISYRSNLGSNGNVLKTAKLHNGGYRLYLFRNKNEALKYQCHLCHHVCFKPVELSCTADTTHHDKDEDEEDDHQHNEDHDGVLFCKLCLELYLRRNHNICPINKRHKNICPINNRWMRKRVNNLMVDCPMSMVHGDHEHDIIDTVDTVDAQSVQSGHSGRSGRSADREDEEKRSELERIHSSSSGSNENVQINGKSHPQRHRHSHRRGQCQWFGKVMDLAKHLESDCPALRLPDHQRNPSRDPIRNDDDDEHDNDSKDRLKRTTSMNSTKSISIKSTKSSKSRKSTKSTKALKSKNTQHSSRRQQIEDNRLQIEMLTKQMALQMEQITLLKKENTTLKAQIKKHSEDTMAIKLEHKRLWDAVHQMNGTNALNPQNTINTMNAVNVSNTPTPPKKSRKRKVRTRSLSNGVPQGIQSSSFGLSESYWYHPQGFEWYHPRPLITKRIHQLPISLIHTEDVKAQITMRRYHPNIRDNTGHWTCCQGARDSAGCSIERTEVMVHPCCGKLEHSPGCMEGFACCGGNGNTEGCVDMSYYGCCKRLLGENDNEDNGVDGCSQRYICCKKPYPKSKGCKTAQ